MINFYDNNFRFFLSKPYYSKKYLLPSGVVIGPNLGPRGPSPALLNART